MRKLLTLLILLTLSAAPAFSQGTATNVRKGPTLPATCTVGQIFFLTAGTIGLYGCTATNTWALGASSAGSIGGTIAANQIAVGSASNVISGSSALTSDGVAPVRSTLGINAAAAAYDVEIANNSPTGTTLNRLACNDGAGKVLTCAHTTSLTNQAIGSVVSGAGTTGNATLCTLGFCTMTFDNQSTVLHYAIASPTIDGELHDVGVSLTSGQPNYLVWTANAGAGTTSQYRLLIGDDFVTGSNTGVSSVGGTLPIASSGGTAPVISINANGITATQLATQYSKWLNCIGKGFGDGLNAIPAGTYLMTTCTNKTGVTVTITGIECFTDNNGSSTLNVTNGAGTALLTGAITCTNSYAAGTQSATVTIANNDKAKFTYVSDGVSKQTDWNVPGTF